MLGLQRLYDLYKLGCDRVGVRNDSCATTGALYGQLKHLSQTAAFSRCDCIEFGTKGRNAILITLPKDAATARGQELRQHAYKAVLAKWGLQSANQAEVGSHGACDAACRSGHAADPSGAAQDMVAQEGAPHMVRNKSRGGVA